MNFWASRELVEVFVFVVAESWEFVQFPWYLQPKLGIIASPNATYIRFLFEKSTVDAETLESIHSLEPSHPTSDDTNFFDICSG